MRNDESRLFKSLAAALLFTCIFYSGGSYAAGFTLTIDAMVEQFATNLPQLFRLVTGTTYVIGCFLIMTAIMGMKHFGEMRTMQSRDHSVTGPIFQFFIGAAILFLPSSITAGLGTFWQNTNPFAYVQANTDQFSTFTSASYGIIQLIGVIAFIRGLLILNKVAGESAGGATIGKGLTHLIGGILCINIYWSIKVIQATLGMTQ